ncbi:hypothetical protein JK231_21575 [Pantoea sp. JGM49]|uniref:hypothetical protein n=1 Tax=Pantoea sp. JGM49 TaxID=2799791 RepID=UPI001BA45697|nr:hypothetical protein [Pantoea sp. JGM49]MBS0883185.1 hypothetical protein [Pantoea sp. JGM49]
MRNRQREQRLIRVITLLDGAALGHDRERIMNLLHSARRASRDGCTTVASSLCFEAVKALSSVSGRLQAAGAAAETLEPVASAIDLLLPDFVTEERSFYARFIAERPVASLAGMSILLVMAALLYGVWRLLST